MELNKILNEVKAAAVRKNSPYIFPISPSYIDELAKVCNFLQEEILKVCDASSVLSDSLNNFSNAWSKSSAEIENSKYQFGISDYGGRKHIYGNI